MTPSAPGDFKRERKFEDETELLGFSPATHPLELYDLTGCLPAERMGLHVGKRAKLAGWLIAAKTVRTKKTGEYMKFLSLEDLTGTFEVTLFPRAHQRFAHLTLTHGPYRAHGRIEDDMGALSLNCDRLELLPARASDE